MPELCSFSFLFSLLSFLFSPFSFLLSLFSFLFLFLFSLSFSLSLSLSLFLFFLSLSLSLSLSNPPRISERTLAAPLSEPQAARHSRREARGMRESLSFDV